MMNLWLKIKSKLFNQKDSVQVDEADAKALLDEVYPASERGTVLYEHIIHTNGNQDIIAVTNFANKITDDTQDQQRMQNIFYRGRDVVYNQSTHVYESVAGTQVVHLGLSQAGCNVLGCVRHPSSSILAGFYIYYIKTIDLYPEGTTPAPQITYYTFSAVTSEEVRKLS